MAQCKRKRAATDQQMPAKRISTCNVQKSITSFASVSKCHQERGDAKKRKIGRDDSRDAVPQFAPKMDKKRKRIGEDEHDCISIKSWSSAKGTTRDANETPATPERKRLRCEQFAIPETPSRGATALFDKLKIESQIASRQEALPDEVLQLQDLYSAFLAAMSLHYSHNGTTSPVNVNALLPMVTKHWKKRNVTLDDLRRVLAVARQAEEAFSLQDYGRAGICLTRAPSRSRALERSSSYIDEVDLNAGFERVLSSLWRAWQQRADQDDDGNGASFLARLPLEQITLNESTQKAAPLFARGQQRLAEIKAAAVRGSAASKPAAASATVTTPQAAPGTPAVATTKNRSTALLDRILAKQTHLASLPAGPSKNALERKAALHRIEDVARVLSLLAGGKERCSFSMPVVTQQLQQSLRNPISREEIERCLDLMAKQITPGFVRIIASGEVTGVVVARNCAVELGILRRRVEEAEVKEC